jgi:hypothetical protein
LPNLDDNEEDKTITFREALEFSGLRTLTAFFEHGPGCKPVNLRDIRFLSISYTDNFGNTGWNRSTTNYASKTIKYMSTSSLGEKAHCKSPSSQNSPRLLFHWKILSFNKTLTLWLGCPSFSKEQPFHFHYL